MTQLNTLPQGSRSSTGPNPRSQSGMDRVVEQTPWQKYRKLVTWIGTTILALLAFWYFNPDSGRTLRIQNDRYRNFHGKYRCIR